MTYAKPEITVLGDAARLIQGEKVFDIEPGTEVNLNPPDCELDS